MTGKAPDCTGLPEGEATARLTAAGYRVGIVRYEGYRTLAGADGYCAVRQREMADGPDGPTVELTVCNFKRGCKP